MATSNSNLATAIVTALDACEVEYAVLHGSDRLRAGTVVSDLDLVVREKPTVVLRRIMADLDRAGLAVVMLWPYDLGETTTVFLLTEDASDGVQVDFLCDPRARGAYGVRSQVLLERRRRVDGVWVLDPADELVYLIAKRLVKQDPARLRELTDRARGEDLDPVVERLLHRRMAVRVRAVLQGVAAPTPVRARLRHVARLATRVRRPIGYWVHVTEREVADGLAARLDRVFPHVLRLDGVPALSAARRAALVRLRPGIALTSGPARPGPVDFHVAAPSLPEAARQLVALMADRTSERLAR